MLNEVYWCIMESIGVLMENDGVWMLSIIVYIFSGHFRSIVVFYWTCGIHY